MNQVFKHNTASTHKYYKDSLSKQKITSDRYKMLLFSLLKYLYASCIKKTKNKQKKNTTAATFLRYDIIVLFIVIPKVACFTIQSE